MSVSYIIWNGERERETYIYIYKELPKKIQPKEKETTRKKKPRTDGREILLFGALVYLIVSRRRQTKSTDRPTNLTSEVPIDAAITLAIK